MDLSSRLIAYLAALIFLFAPLLAAQAQENTQKRAPQQPLAMELGAKASAYPQLSLHLFPSERLSFQVAGFFKDVILADHWAVSSAVLLNLPLRKKVSIKVGPQFTWYGSAFESWHNGSDRLGHALGPVVELDYQISERFRAFVDVAAGIGLEEQGIRTTNTGLGVAYRFKEE